MSDYAERIEALMRAGYPDAEGDLDMHDITDGMEWMADEIERLRADLARPKVKPLEWEADGKGEWARFDLSAGFTAYYVIDQCEHDLSSVSFAVMCHEFGEREVWKGPAAKAKAAAQADYERRVLSALEGYE